MGVQQSDLAVIRLRWGKTRKKVWSEGNGRLWFSFFKGLSQPCKEFWTSSNLSRVVPSWGGGLCNPHESGAGHRLHPGRQDASGNVGFSQEQEPERGWHQSAVCRHQSRCWWIKPFRLEWRLGNEAKHPLQWDYPPTQASFHLHMENIQVIDA